MGVFLILTSFVGIRLAVWINTLLFEGGADGHGAGKGAGANLYISLIFASILSLVAISMLRDALSASKEDTGPSKRISEFMARLKLFPMIDFPVSDVKVSLWVIMAVGLATGYLAGNHWRWRIHWRTGDDLRFRNAHGRRHRDGAFPCHVHGSLRSFELCVSGICRYQAYPFDVRRFLGRHLHWRLRHQGRQRGCNPNCHRGDYYPLRDQSRYRNSDLSKTIGLHPHESRLGYLFQPGQQSNAVCRRYYRHRRDPLECSAGLQAKTTSCGNPKYFRGRKQHGLKQEALMNDPLKIMVVDDESIVGKRLKPALEKSGYEVEVCEDGAGAVKRINEQVFDIVVTDVRMDEIDGMQVLEHVIAKISQHKSHHDYRIRNGGTCQGSLD